MGDLFGETFSCLVADPPWPETGGGQIKRGCDRHYGVIKTLDDLVRVMRSCPQFDRLAADCHAWIWASNRFTIAGDYSDHDGPAWAPELAKRLGFRPVSLVTWAKMEPVPGARLNPGGYVELASECEDFGPATLWTPGQKGIGQYLRGETEQLLFCVRGDGMKLRREHTNRRDIGTLLCAPVPRDEHGKRIHSRKPPESYALIEAASPGPYLEMFARVRHNEKWTVWGNEAPNGA